MSDDAQVDQLRDDIEQTRDNLSDTIEQLEERLAPERLQQDTSEIVREVVDKIMAEVQGKTGDLSQQIADQISSAVQGAATTKSEELMTQALGGVRTLGTSLWERVGQSPAPAALAAVGIGLLAAGSKGSSSPTTAGESENAGSSGAGVMSGVDNLLAKANSAAESLTGAVGSAGQGTGDLLNQAKSSLQTAIGSDGQGRGLVSDQPILAGLLALGLGAAMGLSMPATEKEREATSTLREQAQDRLNTMGIASDPQGMKDQAKEQLSSLASKVTETMTTGLDQAKQTATELASTAKETAADAASERGLTR
jgi:hypothetical protein